jgi:hypothetical protein
MYCTKKTYLIERIEDNPKIIDKLSKSMLLDNLSISFKSQEKVRMLKSVSLTLDDKRTD